MVHFYSRDDIENNAKALNTERGACYQSECKYIAKLTGNEIPAQYRDFYKAARYANNASRLGLDDTEVEIIGKMLDGLGKGTRFAAFPAMQLKHGENAATHSLQCVNVLERTLHQAFRSQADKKVALASLIPARQFAGLTLLIHDMGEICGEAGYATGDSGVRFEGFTKLEMEQRILDRVLNWAIATTREQVDTAKSRKTFSAKLDRLTKALRINDRSDKCETLSLAEFDAIFSKREFAAMPMDATGQTFHDQMMGLWQMAEQPEKVKASDGVTLPENPAFIGNLVKAVEHEQGSRHLVRFAMREKKGKKLGVHQLDEAEIIGNMNYTEGEVGKLFQAVGDEPFCNSVARVQRDHIYATCMKYLDEVLKVHKRTDVLDKAGDPMAQNKVAQEFLGQLETMMSAYEHAIVTDRVPPKGERSFGAACLKELFDSTVTPNHLVHAQGLMAQRERLSQQGSGVAA